MNCWKNIVDPPVTVRIYGQDMEKDGENLLLECESSPSYPPSSLSWRIEQDGKSSNVLGQEILRKKARVLTGKISLCY